MKYIFTINGTLSNLNDYLKAERVAVKGKYGGFNTKGNILKHQTQEMILKCIRRDLSGIRIAKPVHIHYTFYEPNKKRDLDNIASFAMKVTQDSLVLANVLVNDGWSCIVGFDCDFHVDKDNPRIEVELEEIDGIF